MIDFIHPDPMGKYLNASDTNRVISLLNRNMQLSIEIDNDKRLKASIIHEALLTKYEE